MQEVVNSFGARRSLPRQVLLEYQAPEVLAEFGISRSALMKFEGLIELDQPWSK